MFRFLAALWVQCIGGVDPVLADNYSELKIAEQGESPPVAMEPVFDQDFNYGIDMIPPGQGGLTIAEIQALIDNATKNLGSN